MRRKSNEPTETSSIAPMLVTPDGMPMVWMEIAGASFVALRVYGPDLMLNLCEHSRAEGFTHFFMACPVPTSSSGSSKRAFPA